MKLSDIARNLVSRLFSNAAGPQSTEPPKQFLDLEDMKVLFEDTLIIDSAGNQWNTCRLGAIALAGSLRRAPHAQWTQVNNNYRHGVSLALENLGNSFPIEPGQPAPEAGQLINIYFLRSAILDAAEDARTISLIHPRVTLVTADFNAEFAKDLRLAIIFKGFVQRLENLVERKYADLIPGVAQQPKHQVPENIIRLH